MVMMLGVELVDAMMKRVVIARHLGEAGGAAGVDVHQLVPEAHSVLHLLLQLPPLLLLQRPVEVHRAGEQGGGGAARAVGGEGPRAWGGGGCGGGGGGGRGGGG